MPSILQGIKVFSSLQSNRRFYSMQHLGLHSMLVLVLTSPRQPINCDTNGTCGGLLDYDLAAGHLLQQR